MEETKGRKQKYPRINLAFYDDNLEYVREAAYQNRMSITEYVNELIKKDRAKKMIVESMVPLCGDDEVIVIDPEA